MIFRKYSKNGYQINKMFLKDLNNFMCLWLLSNYASFCLILELYINIYV